MCIDKDTVEGNSRINNEEKVRITRRKSGKH